MAGSDTQAPELVLDDEAKQLQLTQFKAQARKAIAEAEAATRKTGLYEAKAQPLAGETTLGENAGSLLGVVALRGLDELAESIGRDLNQAVPGNYSLLIVENRALGATDATHAEVSRRLAWFRTRFDSLQMELEAAEKVLQPPSYPDGGDRSAEFAPLALPAVLGAVQAGSAAVSLVGLTADLIGMFKTNYAIEGRDVSIDYAALAAAVAEHLPNSTVSVVIDGLQTLEHSPTLDAFEALLHKRATVEERALVVEAVELTPWATELEELSAQIAAVRAVLHKATEEGEIAKAEREQQFLVQLTRQRAERQPPEYLERKATVALAKALVASFDQYTTAVTTTAEGQSYPPLIAAALRDLLHANLELGDLTSPLEYVLYLSVGSSAGDVTTQKGHFTRNERLGLVAAVQATWVLVERNGLVVTSGSRGAYSAATFNIDKNEFRWTRQRE